MTNDEIPSNPKITKKVYVETNLILESLSSSQMPALIEKLPSFQETLKTANRKKTEAALFEVLKVILDQDFELAEDFVWFLGFVCRYFLLDVQVEDPFVTLEILHKLQCYDFRNFYCPRRLDLIARTLHDIFQNEPERLASVAFKIADLNPSIHFIFASLSSVEVQDYFNVEYDHFVPWPVSEFRPHFKNLSVTPTSEIPDIITFLRIFSNYFTFCCNSPLVSNFHESKPQMEGFFTFDKTEIAEFQKEVLEWGDAFMDQFNRLHLSNAYDDEAEEVRNLLQRNFLLCIRSKLSSLAQLPQNSEVGEKK